MLIVSYDRGLTGITQGLSLLASSNARITFCTSAYNVPNDEYTSIQGTCVGVARVLISFGASMCIRESDVTQIFSNVPIFIGSHQKRKYLRRFLVSEILVLAYKSFSYCRGRRIGIIIFMSDSPSHCSVKVV